MPAFARPKRRLVCRVDDRPDPEPLVEPQPGDVLGQHGRVGTLFGIVRQALEEERLGAQPQGVAAGPLIDRRPDPASDQPLVGGHEIEEAELQYRLVHQQGEARHAAAVFGHVQHGAEPLLEGVSELLGQQLDFLGPDGGEVLVQHLLDLPDGLLVHRQHVVVYLADVEHGRRRVKYGRYLEGGY